jgi:MoaA/NifB/PqqE/SkfB family radical SAM enzyme
MDAKSALTDGVFCPMPWTGLMYNFDGTVKNCIRSAGIIGNIRDDSIQQILLGDTNLHTQSRMLSGQPGLDCHTCYDLEHGKKRFDIISDRIFYMRELKTVSFDTYQLGHHDLHAIDVRWSNLCNFACVYCNEEYSSRWAGELQIQQTKPTNQNVEDFKTYIFDHVHQLKHVYLAGGEPLLMKENLELLDILWKENPDVNLRINTNLSKVDTRVFETICKFQNVHWTISVESQQREFEYIRWGGNWQDFLENLRVIQKLDHKISFNMLWFLLNFRSLFDCVDFFCDRGFHANSFVIGALLGPPYLNVRHLPQTVLESLATLLEARIMQSPGYLLEDSYRNLLHYIQQPFERDLAGSIQKLRILDQRRGLDSSKIFTDLYELI